ncbi:MAG: hypothetical protein COA78_20390 [Blastopirellula sp.]|nr:MAG: hypothetical protein COA78_20390 [Blastopirellula sp.]
MTVDNVLIELTEVDKWQNKSEYTSIPKATCEEFNVSTSGYGMVVKDLALILGANNCDISRLVEVRRSGTLVFNKVPLKRWLDKSDKRPKQLKSTRPVEYKEV